MTKEQQRFTKPYILFSDANPPSRYGHVQTTANLFQGLLRPPIVIVTIKVSHSNMDPPRSTIRVGIAGNDKGRGLFAAQDFRPGQTVQVFDRPLLALPVTPLLDRLCSHCLRPGKPRGCSRCRAAFYCDAACQKAAWAAVHGRECKALRRLVDDGNSESKNRGGDDGDVPASRRLPTPVRALVQALVCPEVELGLGSLRARRPASGDRGLADLLVMARAGCAFAGVEIGEGEADVVGSGLMKAMDLLCKIQNNAFHRYDADLGQAGIFLEPKLAMANHSCIPNALVHFVGRTAILTAERPIKCGDEIEISYTDYTYPLTKRREALSSYYFECGCRRCAQDLNVYQVCASSLGQGSPPPQYTSLVGPDLASQLRNHAAVAAVGDDDDDDDDEGTSAQTLARTGSEAAVRLVESVCASSSSSDAKASSSTTLRRETLRAQWRHCADLFAAGLYAVTPQPQVLTELAIDYAERGDYVLALVVACFVASRCDPYRYATAFHPVRLKNVLVVAKMLAHTAEETASLDRSVGTNSTDLEGRIRHELREIDQVSLCQILLTLVLRSNAALQWELATEAREMLHDIQQLPGREREVSLISAWARDPADDRNRAFFDFAVVQQVDTLARLGRELLRAELEKNDA
ncbi:hypothetical protein CP532_1089 [Ophiocordyceps camponoti-leonardi (nom. inval.)]|nr:hypothetical protein CP532_1089 [Ophiocordyceps camponoti-leonardi (nom. inval.)]